MRAHSYEQFFASPFEPGRFWWTLEGHTMLLQWGTRRGQHLLLYMSREPNNWARPGAVLGFDGNLDEPTLSPSIGLRDGAGGWQFHGFLEKGVLKHA